MTEPDWIDQQLRRRGIGDERVLAAMARVPRELFVPETLRDHAYEDAALPLAHGQTVSQPFIVAVTCQGLRLRGDERVLDVGTGSGYAAAVLAELAREVHSIERIPELAEAARASLAAAGYERVQVHVGDGWLGLPEHAPYDGIAVAAAAPKVPQALWAELREGGRIVLPLGSRRRQELCAIERTPEGPRLVAAVPARFVPLVQTGGRDAGH
jgi:protein-L-isoaspartate(D-aspartate) O-methyltransferase